MIKDYYEILEVHPKASQEVIKRAYQTLAKKYHPDTTVLDYHTANAKMQELNEAYQVLSNVDKRKKYDVELEVVRRQNGKDSVKSYEQDSGKENIKQTVYEICTNTIERIEKSINYLDGYGKTNKAVSDGIARQFESTIAKYLTHIKDNKGDTQILATNVGIAYWKIAIAYSWSDDWENAYNYVCKAAKYIPESAAVYIDFVKSFERIKESRGKAQKREFFSFIKRGLAVLGCIFILFYIFRDSNPPTNPQPVAETEKTKETTSEEKAKKKPVPSPSYTPKPKQNVITGYVQEEKQLNYDGICRLTIDNTRNDYPVYVRVWYLDVKEPYPVRAFNIGKGSKFTAEELTPGNYEVRYRTLYEDDSIPKDGSKSQPFELVQIEDDDGIRYSDVKLTLYKVSNGNTKTTAIPGDEV